MDYKNGSRVLKVFNDGSGEFLASFQYYNAAKGWAQQQAQVHKGDIPLIFIAIDDCCSKFEGFSNITPPQPE